MTLKFSVTMNEEDLLLTAIAMHFHAASFQFSFGPVSRIGNEATDGSTTLDIAVPVVAHIFNPPNNLLTSDTVIILSVTGGSATSRSKIFVVCNCVHCYMFTTVAIFFHLQWDKTLICLKVK